MVGDLLQSFMNSNNLAVDFKGKQSNSEKAAGEDFVPHLLDKVSSASLNPDINLGTGVDSIPEHRAVLRASAFAGSARAEFGEKNGNSFNSKLRASIRNFGNTKIEK